VCRAPRKLVDRLHFLSLVQACIGRPFLGDVPGDLGESNLLSLIANRIDNHISPKATSVLSNSPTLHLHSSLARGHLGTHDRKLGASIFFGIKPGKVLSDNFFRFISLDRPSTGVPTHDPSARIEHKNRAVRGTVEEQFEASLRRLQLPTCSPQFPRPVAHRVFQGLLAGCSSRSASLRAVMSRVKAS
jgi:hypothetical protein